PTTPAAALRFDMGPGDSVVRLERSCFGGYTVDERRLDRSRGEPSAWLFAGGTPTSCEAPNHSPRRGGCPARTSYPNPSPSFWPVRESPAKIKNQSMPLLPVRVSGLASSSTVGLGPLVVRKESPLARGPFPGPRRLATRLA